MTAAVLMKIDIHLHTTHGSACSYMDPDQLVTKAKSVGLDGICITEHDQIWDQYAIERLSDKHDFLVMGGVEIATDYGEVLVFGLHQSVLSISSIFELKERVDDAGAAMVLAHPLRAEYRLVSEYPDFDPAISPDLPNALDSFCRMPAFNLVDAMETFNGQSGIHEGRLAGSIARHLNLPDTGGSDAHAVLGVGSCYTLFEESVRGEEDLICQIKAGKMKGVDDRWKQEEIV
jgi:predicted metal-dependent phosphoesterase TrpH